MSEDLPSGATKLGTRILKASTQDYLGSFKEGDGVERLGVWAVSQDQTSSMNTLREAAEYLKTKDLPVAFPTETVYGLGADATRSASVKSIYAAKGRPSDNPLIVHVPDLEMLRSLLQPKSQDPTSFAIDAGSAGDVIPAIYKPLVQKFWPGPLTILLPNPVPSKLAPEVTAGLKTFGARMPSSPLALSLIKMANAPLAGPSANASTKPSPTTAQHVLDDLDGRLEIILDGGPCTVGVESTVVDGLCDPPVILRPGGVSLAEIRACPGWEKVEQAYKDQAETGKAAPRAPGMKYKHYSPKARVVLYETAAICGKDGVQKDDLDAFRAGFYTAGTSKVTVGIIRTRYWKPAAGLSCGQLAKRGLVDGTEDNLELDVKEADLFDSTASQVAVGTVMDVCIGADARSIAHGLFSALRELDRRGCDIIFVEGTVDDEDIGAAVMNRLRKAASQIRT